MVPRRGRTEEEGRRDEGRRPGHRANRKGDAASLAGLGGKGVSSLHLLFYLLP